MVPCTRLATTLHLLHVSGYDAEASWTGTGTRRLSRLVFTLVLCGGLALGGFQAVHWYASPAYADAACARPDSLRCKICQLLDRADCSSGPDVGCPARTLDYSNRFPQFEAKLTERKTLVARWKSFRDEMEVIQNRDSFELCRKHLDRMKRTETEIPAIERCPSESPNLSRPKEIDVFGSSELAALKLFRDCSDAKSREISKQIRERLLTEGGTAQLLSFKNEISKISVRSITLLQEFREQTNVANQSRCWLRDRIRDCQN